jgi:hypothetical protein
MGYYADVGVGGVKDLHASLKWYTWVSVPWSYDIFLCIYKPWCTATQTCQNTHAVLPCTEYDSMTLDKLYLGEQHRQAPTGDR